MTSFLFLLSKYYLVPFFIDWLDIVDFGSLQLSLNKHDKKIFESLLIEYRENYRVSWRSVKATLPLNQIICRCSKGLPVPGGLTISTQCLSELNQCFAFSIFHSWSISARRDILRLYFHELTCIELYPLPGDSRQSSELLFSLCPNVEELVIHSMPVEYDLLEVIAQHSSLLKKLCIHGKTDLGLKSLEKLLFRCTSLTDIRICNEITFTEVDAVSFMTVLLGDYPLLVNIHMCIQNTTNGFRNSYLVVKSFAVKQLVSLTCDYFNSVALQKFFELGGGQCLEYLDVSGCSSLAHTDLSGICRYCPHLTDLRTKTKVMVNQQAGECHPLKELVSLHAVDDVWFLDLHYNGVSSVLEWTKDFSTGILELRIPYCESIMLSAFPNVHTLILLCVFDITIFKAAMERLSSSLTSLTITYTCTTPSVVSQAADDSQTIMEAIECIGRYCTLLKTLIVWDWQQCHCLTGMASHWPRLVEVGLLADCPTVAEDFLTGCPKLRKLHLRHCGNWTVHQWSTLLQGSNLTELHLIFQDCDKNPVILKTIFKSCRALRKLYVSGCRWEVDSIYKLKMELMKMNPCCLVSIVLSNRTLWH